MLNSKSAFALAVVFPIFCSAIPAEAAKNTSAARAECFRQANEAAAKNPNTTPGGTTNAYAADAYRACCKKAGIRP